MISWKGTLKRLVRRIKNVRNRTAFSVRERKLLKRIIKQQYVGKALDYDRILYDFPGKSRENLIKECEKIFRGFSKNLKKKFKNIKSSK